MENGLMEGVGDRFLPNKATTRAELVTILHRLEGKPAPQESPSFTDVKAGSRFASQVQWAAENGIVRGYADGSFQPNREISRQEFAAIFYRYADYKNYDVDRGRSLDEFPDKSQVDAYAQVPLQWATDVGLITGSSGRLNGHTGPDGHHSPPVTDGRC
ncbi:S-layer homology domain-containing protein [Acutalibacter sp. 1XD8-33]|uniref:S-layer homology domain-containing protein n=1 Tax=Acutalibacter sp. 1XD8-33 TaxID=2320081 RepID=UPI001313E618|nr:S-layer homology domain-containing protein [Acutalibacter sp. 1XD8-33]